MWRTGMAIASGGFMWGLANLGFFFYDFTRRAIPALDEYAESKVSFESCKNERGVFFSLSNASPQYADSWHDYKKETKWVLIPYIY